LLKYIKRRKSMKKRIIGLVVAVAIMAAVSVGCAGAEPTEVEENTGDITPTAIVSAGVETQGGLDLAPNNFSRGYIDVDLSGDWSEGDIELTPDGEGGYYVPVQ
jgi:FlaG/FlaF family flagellin (archaellin)